MQFIQNIIDLVMRPIRWATNLMRQVTIGPRSVLGLSLPARLALILFVCLLLTVVAVYYGFKLNERNYAIGQWLGGGGAILVGVLLILIPVLFYYALRLWLEGELSAFPEIDHAWRAGLAEMRRQGLDLGQIPVFLILGSQGEEQERGFFQASRWSLNVKDVPDGLHPLHWYANPEGIFLVCTDVGCLSKLSRDGIRKIEDANANVAPLAAGSKVSVRETMAPGSLQQSAMVSDLAMSAPVSSFRPDLQGTMMPSLRETAAPIPSSGRSQWSGDRIGLTEEEQAEQQRRLAYVCQLLKRSRAPICPINGLLTILPYQVIMWEGAGDVAVERALRADLSTVKDSLKLRCPTTALICGMERESGFRELVRRVGLERARDQRFGKGYELESPPLSEQLCAVNAHACGAFEDWVYALFRERDALGQAGNTKLYALLCKVRNQLQERMVKVMECYVGQPEDEPLFFGGCYFAGAGEREDTQAFVRSVLAKMLKQQGDLQWVDGALSEDRFYQKLAFLGFMTDAVLAGTILVLLVLLLRGLR